MSPNNILPRIILLALLMLSFNSVADSGSLQTTINGEHRSKAHQNRDQSRHPGETLAFFGVEPDMTVVEIWPGVKAGIQKFLPPILKIVGCFMSPSLMKIQPSLTLVKFCEIQAETSCTSRYLWPGYYYHPATT